MGHADEHGADAAFGRIADDLVEDRHGHVEPFDREPRLGLEGAMQEALERLDLRQTIEQRHRVIGSAGARKRPRSTADRSHWRCSGRTRASSRGPRWNSRARGTG